MLVWHRPQQKSLHNNCNMICLALDYLMSYLSSVLITLKQHCIISMYSIFNIQFIINLQHK